jgi:hypothetical protein
VARQKRRRLLSSRASSSPARLLAAGGDAPVSCIYPIEHLGSIPAVIEGPMMISRLSPKKYISSSKIRANELSKTVLASSKVTP